MESDKKVLYFDVETTGLNPYVDEIVQLAYIIEVNGEVVLGNSMFIKPVEVFMFDPKVLELLGRTEQDIMAGIEPKEAHRIFTDDLAKHCDKFNKNDKLYPAGYNVAFDLDFLAKFFEKQGDNYLGSWLNWKAVDPLSIMRIMDFQGRLSLPDYKLATVCQHYGIELNAHNALNDIKATRRLLNLFLKRNNG